VQPEIPVRLGRLVRLEIRELLILVLLGRRVNMGIQDRLVQPDSPLRDQLDLLEQPVPPVTRVLLEQLD